MPRTATVWLVGTTLVAVPLAAIGAWRGDAIALKAMLLGVGVSLLTVIACAATVGLVAWRKRPLERMLLETSLRMALPLSFLLAVLVTRRDLLDNTFLLYFLPFQFLTIIATSAGAIGSIELKNNKSTDDQV